MPHSVNQGGKQVLVKIDSPEVVHETLDGEVVVVNFKNGRYYSFENVGSEVWSCIERGLDTDATIALVAAKYQGDPAEIMTNIDQFVADLLREGLVVPAESAPPTAANDGASVPWSAEPKQKFRPAALIKYDDMEGLLLLDVAHDEDA